jgi:hypothetical protein
VTALPSRLLAHLLEEDQALPRMNMTTCLPRTAAPANTDKGESL